MKSDRYTKTVLTVIALCLVIIAGKNLALFPAAQASNADQTNSFTLPLNADGTVDVRVVEMPDVTIDSRWKTVNVNVVNTVEVTGQVDTN